MRKQKISNHSRETQEQKRVRERLDNLQIPNIHKEFEEYKMKMNLNPQDDGNQKRGFFKRNKKKQSEEELLNKFLELNYSSLKEKTINLDDIRIIRKEVISEASLQDLSIFNKIVVTIREMNRASGKTKRKLEEKQRKADKERTEKETDIGAKLKKVLNSQLENNVNEITVSINIPDKDIQYLNRVIEEEYFNQFEEIYEIQRNPNYLDYKSELPRVINFVVKKEAEI